MRIKLSAVIFLLCVSPAAGQTVSEIEGKYGKPVNAYSVSEHIWMTPDYTADGQVVEERSGSTLAAAFSASVPDVQYIWGADGNIILRDRNADGTSSSQYGQTASGLEERIYAIHGPNGNITATSFADRPNQFKLTGMYILPWHDVIVSGNASLQQGTAVTRQISRAVGFATNQIINLEPLGNTRLEPLNKIDAWYPGHVVEKRDGLTVLDLTIVETETGNPYVVMPVPGSVRKAR